MSDEPVRLRLKYADENAFVERFAANVTRGGVFVASREPRAVGDVIRFEIGLVRGPALLSGEGKVTWVRPFDPAAPNKPHGMGVQFVAIDAATRPMLDRLLAARAAAAARGQAAARPPEAARSDAPRTGVGPRPAALDPTALADFDQGVEEVAIRRAFERARVLGNRQEDDFDVESLLKPEPLEPVASVEQARSELQRMLGRRNSSIPRAPVDDERAAEPATNEPAADEAK